MVEETKPELNEDEKQLNRQINYFIMRYMWQVVHGRKRNDTDTIYVTFETSRERFTRVINTGKIRYGKGELDGLQQRTGLRKEIFTGEARFDCSSSVKTKTGIKKTEISTDEWKALFEWRSMRKEQPKLSDAKQKPDGKPQKTCQDEICDRLRNLPRNNAANVDFYRLCYFLQYMEASPIRVTSGKFREITTNIEELSFTLLDGCDIGQLQSLKILLKDKLNLVGAMVTYKNARNEARKK